MTRHVAASGTRAGQWVTCNAKNQCRLGGSHISERDFYATRAWLQENNDPKKATDVTKDDVERFQAATVNDKRKWEVAAEKLARKNKGLKDYDVPVFNGEENLIKVVPKEAIAQKKFVPAGQNKDSKPESPKPSRYIDIPEVRDFLLNGNFDSIRGAIKKYNIPDDVKEALASRRAILMAHTPDEISFTSSKTKEVKKLSEIQELQEYLQTGKEDLLAKAKNEYMLGENIPTAVQNERQRIIRQEAAEENRLKNEAKKEENRRDKEFSREVISDLTPADKLAVFIGSKIVNPKKIFGRLLGK